MQILKGRKESSKITKDHNKTQTSGNTLVLSGGRKGGKMGIRYHWYLEKNIADKRGVGDTHKEKHPKN